MNKKLLGLIAGGGCLVLVLFLAGILALFWFLVPQGFSAIQATEEATPTARAVRTVRAIPIPTLTPAPKVEEQAPTANEGTSQQNPSAMSEMVTALYQQVNPGVVRIRVTMKRDGQIVGQGAGSGFVLDKAGHIITNNHVVGQADEVIVVFYNGIEAEAQIVGLDKDSDLAIIQVDDLPTEVSPVPLGDSDQVKVGEWVVAIGNPFGLGSSITLGIVSALGRTIPSGVTPFSIPQAIQTDAAINPGNSGGPLLNMRGQVIGVNAQIASGSGANAGVGFAIPVNVVRHVAPGLIRDGEFDWPWLGVRGTSVNLIIMEANDLETQQGAYIVDVVSGGPADEAHMRGTSGTKEIDGMKVPVGGDVVIEVDGQPIENFSDLLIAVAFGRPGDQVALTVLRDGQRRQINVELAARPSDIPE